MRFNALEIPKYLKPEYLAIYVSLFAVILSQFPPIYQIFSKPKPAIVLQQQATFTHNIGRTVINLPVTISNTGSKSLLISKVECNLEKLDSDYKWTANAQSYFDKNNISPLSPPVELPIGELLVDQNQRWQETIICYKIPSPAQIDIAQSILSSTNRYLSEANANRHPNDQRWIELPEKIIDSAVQEFSKNFKLEAGDYKLSVRLISKSEETLAIHSGEMSISQSEIDRVKDVKKDYKYGFELNSPASHNSSIFKALIFNTGTTKK